MCLAYDYCYCSFGKHNVGNKNNEYFEDDGSDLGLHVYIYLFYMVYYYVIYQNILPKNYYLFYCRIIITAIFMAFIAFVLFA